MSSFFKTETPISGGNTNTVESLIKTIDSNIGIATTYNGVSKLLTKFNSSAGNTYNFFWLLQFQADYFSNLINFAFENWELNRQVCLAIRTATIYGSSCLWRNGNNYVAMYINKLEYDDWGKPKKVKMYRADNVLLDSSFDTNKKLNWIEKEIDDNIIVFLPFNYNCGGLIKWKPFLTQLEKLLKMLYTKSFSYVKSILYNIKDTQSTSKEIELFFNSENPFLINTSDDSLIANKFKEFSLNATSQNQDGLISYIQDFLNIYYDLIGRRYNSDKKAERNVSDEINASQENYDVLQREIKVNIMYFLREIENRFGKTYKILKGEF